MLFRATLFSAFGESKRWLGTNADGTTRELRNIDYYKAGMMTGFVAAFTEAPIDFYKSQIQVQILRSKADPTYKPPYTSVVDCVKSTLRTSGVRGPFQGLGPTILRNTPANAVYLGSFEVMKKKMAEVKECKVSELSAPLVIGAGGFGGVLYWLCIYPVDVVKSAMMTDSIVPSERKYPNMLSTARKLWGRGRRVEVLQGLHAVHLAGSARQRRDALHGRPHAELALLVPIPILFFVSIFDPI